MHCVSPPWSSSYTKTYDIATYQPHADTPAARGMMRRTRRTRRPGRGRRPQAAGASACPNQMSKRNGFPFRAHPPCVVKEYLYSFLSLRLRSENSQVIYREFYQCPRPGVKSRNENLSVTHPFPGDGTQLAARRGESSFAPTGSRLVRPAPPRSYYGSAQFAGAAGPRSRRLNPGAGPRRRAVAGR